jgi:NADPH:quinone reductase-like Zn-dependent oxidoreductase
VPEGVSQAEAATLPIAGLSALYALERAGSLLGRRVLVTGATGGVGLFACQLARDAGAHVTALVRRTEQAEEVRAAGAHEVAVGRGSDAAALGPFDAIVDSVGGEVLGATMGALAYGGVCVSLGATEAREATFDVGRFFSSGGRMDGFLIFNEVGRRPIAADLGRLLAMVAAGRLKTSIAREAPWAEVGLLVQELLDRRFTGKAVLHVGG